MKLRAPCVRCIALKKKCSDFRPCTACIKASRSADCMLLRDLESQYSTAESTTRKVERPLPYVAFSIYRSRDSLLIKHITDIGWRYAAVKRFCSLGFMPDSLAESIYYLSPQVKREICEAFMSVQTAVLKARLSNSGNLFDNFDRGQGSKETLVWLLDGHDSSEEAITCGLMVLGIDTTSQICHDVRVNSHIAGLFQMHRCGQFRLHILREVV